MCSPTSLSRPLRWHLLQISGASAGQCAVRNRAGLMTCILTPFYPVNVHSS